VFPTYGTPHSTSRNIGLDIKIDFETNEQIVAAAYRNEE